MKAVLAGCLLAMMTGAAAATLAAREPVLPPQALEAWLIDLGPAGAMLESNYFHAQQGPFVAGPVTPCRLHRSRTADGVHLSFSCR